MADDATLYLYEFLYRGRPPGASEPPDYHVILAQDRTDAFGNATTASSQAMTPQQAKTLGFDLPQIIAAIDAAVMSENAALKAKLAELQAMPAKPAP